MTVVSPAILANGKGCLGNSPFQAFTIRLPSKIIMGLNTHPRVEKNSMQVLHFLSPE